MLACLLNGCKPEQEIESRVKFSSSNQSGVLKEDNEINGKDAVDIIRSYSKNELMLSAYKEFSFFISSETAVYDYENYYKVVAGTVSKNDFDYYTINEIGCYLVSLNGEKAFMFDKENNSVLPLNIIRDIVE
ncbi:MAG: hypothetical protein K2G56_00595 [Eubacterium sp.]|nr:hypothetical protein [Eubacterium sp.]